MGHGTCTCEGAAFEYVVNVDHELREAGVRDRARLVYLTNEARLGDFGVDDITFDDRGFTTSSELWTSSLYRERGVEAIVGAHVHRVDPGVISFETLDGVRQELDFDFAMLMPPFGGVPLLAVGRDGADITSQLFAPNGFMRVDADYFPKPYEMWRGADWPSTYQALGHPRIFAVGIAFAPPHQISRPRVSPTGTVITPSAPRTGMPSGVMGKTAALTIVDRVRHGDDRPAHVASMAQMGAATVASAGAGLRRGSAAARDHAARCVARLQHLSHRSRPRRHPRGDRAQRPLGQAADAPPVHVQGPGPSRLAADPGVSDMGHETFSPSLDLSTAPVPTDRTLRRRQSLPVQALRFVAFAVRLVRMVLKRHR